MRGKRAKQIRRLAQVEAEQQALRAADERSWCRRLWEWWLVFRGTHQVRQNPILDWKKNARFLKRYYTRGSRR